MKMSQVYAIVDRLWNAPGSVGWVKRNRKSPRFQVGYTSLGTQRARVVGSSDVDWESAFASAVENDPTQRANIVAAMAEVLS